MLCIRLFPMGFFAASAAAAVVVGDGGGVVTAVYCYRMLMHSINRPTDTYASTYMD